MGLTEYLILAAIVAVLAIALVVGLVASRRRRTPPAATTPTELAPEPAPVESPAAQAPAAPVLERPEGTASRLVRLRQRLAGSQGGLGRGLLALLSRDRLDEDTWENIE